MWRDDRGVWRPDASALLWVLALAVLAGVAAAVRWAAGC